MRRNKRFWTKTVAVLAIALGAVFGSSALAGCVPVGVGEWLDTNTSGSPGLLGYHHRLKKQTFSCSRFGEDKSERVASMFFYVDLPANLEMVEYASVPVSFRATAGYEKDYKYSEKDLYTILYLAGPLTGESLSAARALLNTGEVEILMARYDVDVPDSFAGMVKVFFRVNPARADGLLEVEGVPLPLVELDWAINYFFAQAP
ncbi:hypothetical protein [Oceanithermus sp.]